ncbi:hypothetical protein Tco_0402063, partial [Tanacetum coccineum]
VVMDHVDNRFTYSLAFPFSVKGNAISITWSLDTPGIWKRLTIDVIFEMCSRGFDNSSSAVVSYLSKVVFFKGWKPLSPLQLTVEEVMSD